MLEYRDCRPEDRSVVTVLYRAPCYKPGFNGTEVRLQHRTAGWECAGSAARLTTEGYAVQWTRDNATHGQRYRTFDEARAHFERLCCSAAGEDD